MGEPRTKVGRKRRGRKRTRLTVGVQIYVAQDVPAKPGWKPSQSQLQILQQQE